jgi:colanic acid biosynthesis glycosyl transferase WcaI
VKVLIVSQYFWPENFRINDLAVSLKQKGHEVEVLTGHPNYPGGQWFAGYSMFSHRLEEWEGVQVHRVPMFRRYNSRGIRLVLNYLSYAMSASLWGPFFLFRKKFDLIFVYEPSPVTVGIPAIILSWIKRAPIFFWVQDLWPESLLSTGAVKSPFVLKMVRLLVQWIYNSSKLVLIQSRNFRDKLAYFSLPERKIRYFPNSAEDLYVPLEKEKTPMPPALSTVPPGTWLMFAGNLGVAQDIPTILGAAKNLPPESDVQFIILGEGREKKNLENLISQYQLKRRVHLLGGYPMKQMPQFFAWADAMLVTLKKDPVFEVTIPGKVQSYLACGKPIIAALDGEGAKVILEAQAGMVGPSGDIETMSTQIQRFVQISSAEKAAMGLRSRKYFEAHFSKSHLIENLENWYKEVSLG